MRPRILKLVDKISKKNVRIYNSVHKRRLLKKQLAMESALTGKESMDILHEFETFKD